MQDTNVKEYYDQKAAVHRLTASLEQELFDLYEEIDLEEQKDTPNDYVIRLSAWDHQMEKLIIENRTDEPMEKILPYINHVISMGKISGNMNEQYCYHTTFDNGFAVSAYRNKKSDRLVVGTYNNAMNSDQDSAG